MDDMEKLLKNIEYGITKVENAIAKLPHRDVIDYDSDLNSIRSILRSIDFEVSRKPLNSAYYIWLMGYMFSLGFLPVQENVWEALLLFFSWPIEIGQYLSTLLGG